MKRWEGLAEDHIAQLATCGTSDGYQQRVRRELELFGGFLKRRKTRVKIEDVDADMITQYVAKRTPFKAKSTLSGILSVLRGWGNYLMKEGLWRGNPLRWMSGPRRLSRNRLPKRIGKEKMEALWQTVARKSSPFRRSMWMAVIGVLYGTGARRGELVRLDVDDWNRDEGTLLIDGRKSGQERMAPVPELVWRCLETYLPERHNLLESLGKTNECALFINRDGKRANPNTLLSSLKRLGRSCDLNLTFHQFRHTCASDLLEAGALLPEVQKLLGHEHLATTMWYTDISNPKLAEAVKLHPINKMLSIGGNE
jgi:integrase/recombinase XerD